MITQSSCLKNSQKTSDQTAISTSLKGPCVRAFATQFVFVLVLSLNLSTGHGFPVGSQSMRWRGSLHPGFPLGQQFLFKAKPLVKPVGDLLRTNHVKICQALPTSGPTWWLPSQTGLDGSGSLLRQNFENIITEKKEMQYWLCTLRSPPPEDYSVDHHLGLNLRTNLQNIVIL